MPVHDAFSDAYPKPVRTPEPCVEDRTQTARLTNLVVGLSALGELEVDALASEALVDLAVGVEPVVDTAALLLIEDNLEDFAAVLAGAETLADDLDRVDKVGQDSVVDSGQGSRLGTLLGLVAARAVGALGTGKNAAGGNEDDVAVRELLLELTGQAIRYQYTSVVIDMNRAYRCWALCHPARRGTGTKMTIALRPWPTSI